MAGHTLSSRAPSALPYPLSFFFSFVFPQHISLSLSPWLFLFQSTRNLRSGLDGRRGSRRGGRRGSGHTLAWRLPPTVPAGAPCSNPPRAWSCPAPSHSVLELGKVAAVAMVLRARRRRTRSGARRTRTRWVRGPSRRGIPQRRSTAGGAQASAEAAGGGRASGGRRSAQASGTQAGGGARASGGRRSTQAGGTRRPAGRLFFNFFIQFVGAGDPLARP
ncbi:hypothetical protein PVAP13_8NG178701 [Panicum virgatum]|uniref:Uncharacterized protein n=1 Tax=Panicum virgatum TaxID=38727 RepID=A0A8T0PCC9_PANVG|nr:hypothetical protein PVAP13_8NG178701 [Panicum virgatum]